MLNLFKKRVTSKKINENEIVMHQNRFSAIIRLNVNFKPTKCVKCDLRSLGEFYLY